MMSNNNSTPISLILKEHLTMRSRIGWKNLFILGLVAEKDRYGYELKKILIDYYLTAGITMTTIYRSLKYAEKYKWAKGKYKKSKKRYFTKYLYSITTKGKEKLKDEVEYYLSQSLMIYFKEFNTAIRFRFVLEENKIILALKKRKKGLLDKLNNLPKYKDDPGPGSRISFQHVQNYLHSEIMWVNDYLDGKFSNDHNLLP